MTKRNALLGELEPYSPGVLTVQKALSDVGVDDPDAEYAADSDKRTIALAAINVLNKLIVLSSDSVGKSSQSYNVAGLISRIRYLCAENGLEVSDYMQEASVEDGSNLW